MMCMWQGGYVQASSEARDTESPGAGFIGGHELPDVGAGNPIPVFHKSSLSLGDPVCQPRGACLTH